MFRYELVNSTRKFTIVAEIVSLLKKIYKRDAPFRAVFKVKTLAVLFSAYPREMKHILRNLNLPPFWCCLFLWKWCNPFPRARARLKHAHSFDRCGPEVAILGADQKERGLWGRECKDNSSYKALFETLEFFGECSGLKVNHEKTEIFALGNSTLQDVDFPKHNICVNIKLLGVYFGYDVKQSRGCPKLQTNLKGHEEVN